MSTLKDIKGDVKVLKATLRIRWQSYKREQKLLEELRAQAVRSMNFRLKGMNEFRHQIEATAARYLDKNEYYASNNSLLEKIESLAKASEIRFRTLERLVWTAAGGILVIVFTLNYLKSK